jgi:hypothetical protein
LAEVEYLLSQSAQGNHVLFDPEILRQALLEDARPGRPADEAEAYAVEPHLERMLERGSLEGMREYARGLEHELQVKLVRAYLNVVENALYERSEVRH